MSNFNQLGVGGTVFVYNATKNRLSEGKVTSIESIRGAGMYYEPTLDIDVYTVESEDGLVFEVDTLDGLDSETVDYGGIVGGAGAIGCESDVFVLYSCLDGALAEAVRDVEDARSSLDRAVLRLEVFKAAINR